MNLGIDSIAWMALTACAVTFCSASLILVIYQLRRAVNAETQLRATCALLWERFGELEQRSDHTARVHVDIERRVKGLGLRQDQLEIKTTENRPYSHAISLVKKGAGVDDLMAACGLSQGEAELICLVHGMRAEIRETH